MASPDGVPESTTGRHRRVHRGESSNTRAQVSDSDSPLYDSVNHHSQQSQTDMHPERALHTTHDADIRKWNNRNEDFDIPNPISVDDIPNPISVDDGQYMTWYNNTTQSDIHHNPPPMRADQAASALLSPGSFQELENSNQVWLESSKIVIRNIRIVMAAVSGSVKHDCMEILNAIRRGFVASGEESAFERLMEEPLEECNPPYQQFNK